MLICFKMEGKGGSLSEFSRYLLKKGILLAQDRLNQLISFLKDKQRRVSQETKQNIEKLVGLLDVRECRKQENKEVIIIDLCKKCVNPDVEEMWRDVVIHESNQLQMLCITSCDLFKMSCDSTLLFEELFAILNHDELDQLLPLVSQTCETVDYLKSLFNTARSLFTPVDFLESIFNHELTTTAAIRALDAWPLIYKGDDRVPQAILSIASKPGVPPELLPYAVWSATHVNRRLSQWVRRMVFPLLFRKHPERNERLLSGLIICSVKMYGRDETSVMLLEGVGIDVIECICEKERLGMSDMEWNDCDCFSFN